MKLIGSLYKNEGMRLFLSKEKRIYVPLDDIKPYVSSKENIDLIKRIYKGTNGLVIDKKHNEYLEERVVYILLNKETNKNTINILLDFLFICSMLKDKKYKIKQARETLKTIQEYFSN